MSTQELEKRKSVGTREYFQRYFSYGIHKIDFSDAEIDSFIRNCTEQTYQEISREIESLLAYGGRESLFIIKLHRQIEIINDTSEASEALAKALAFQSARWKHSNTWFSQFHTLRSHAIGAITNCIKAIADQELQKSIFAEIVLEIADLPFSNDLLSNSHWGILYKERDFYKSLRKQLT